MAIGLLTTLTARGDISEEFEKAFSDLAEQVRANEPGNQFCALLWSGIDSQVYIAMEQCASQGALDAQSQSDHVREAKKTT